MGLFDQEIDPVEGVSLEPSPMLAPLTPPELGVPPPAQTAPVPMPTPPQMPAGPGNAQKVIAMALLGLAAGLGPRRGNGIAQGLAMGQHANEVERQTQFRNEQAVYKEQRQEALRQQALQQQQARYEAEQAARRQQAFAQALTSIRNEAKELRSKAEYDERIAGYAGLLQASGYRVDENYLRQAVPYVKPSLRDRAREVLAAIYNDPLNKEHMKNDPVGFENGSTDLELTGEPNAKPRRWTIRELREAGGASPVFSPDGKALGFVSSTDGPAFNISLKTKLARFRADHNREPNEAEMEALVTEARKTPSTQDPEMLALTKELAQQRLADAKTKASQPSGLPAQAQRRVDIKSKGFESNQIVKNTQKMAEAVGFANSLNINTKNPADDQALIYAFAKAMDPDSVVREGEYATVQKYAQSWAESFGFNAKRIFSNTAFLTPQARQNMKTTITAKFSAGRQQYENLRKSYADQINRITGQSDGDSYLTDYGGAFPEDAAASARRKLDGKP